MKKSIRKILAVAGILCLAFCVCTLVACNTENEVETTAADTTEAPAEVTTTETTTTEEITETDTVTTTEATTDATTDGETTADETTSEETTEQATTEPETTVSLPEDKPTDPAIITFCETPLNEKFIKVNNAAAYEIVNDSEKGAVLKLTTKTATKNADPNVQINYASYMQLAGLEPISPTKAQYAILLVKLEGVSSANCSVTTFAKIDGKSKNVKADLTYDTSKSDWQYVMVPAFTDNGDGSLTAIKFEFIEKVSKVGEAVYLKSITFVDSKEAAIDIMGDSLLNIGTATVVIPGLTKEYTFLHVTDTHVSSFSDADKAGWTQTRIDYNTARRNAFMANGIYAEERFPLFFNYANQIGVDGMFLTGDLIDFPSEKNVSTLYANASSISGKPIFNLGNHDWNYSDDYMTPNAVATYKPLFTELCGGDTDLSVVEYDEFIIAAVDNSGDVVTDATVAKFFKLYEKNKPIILLLHVPLHADTLAPDVKAAWGGRNITMGIGAMGNDWQSVRDFYTSVCLSEDSPVVAVFAGHVHFNHEDSFPNGVKQYVTSAGYFGDCRLVTIKGAD